MVDGIKDRFNVHSVLMLTYLQPKDIDYKLGKNKEEPESGSFNSILQHKIKTVKAIQPNR